MKEVKKLSHYIQPEHFNGIFIDEASSAMSLTKDIAEKLNEVIDTVNEALTWNLGKHQEQDGRISKGILYMKDNLLNTLQDLLDLKGYDLIDRAVKENIEGLISAVSNYDGDVVKLEKRLNTLIEAINTGTETNGEIVDARIGNDGITYPNAGDAIRSQFERTDKLMKNALGEVVKLSFAQGSIQGDGTVVNTTTTICSDFIPYSDELIFVEFNDNITAQYFLYDGSKNIITNTAAVLSDKKGVFRIKHRYHNIESAVKYIRFNLKYAANTTITPDDLTGFMLVKLPEYNHCYMDPQEVYESLSSVKLNQLNLHGYGIATDGTEAPSLTRQSTAEPIHCGVNANVYIKCNNDYQVRGFYYSESGIFMERLDGGLVDGGVAFVAKYPKFKLVFSRKDNQPIDSEEVLANYEIIIHKPNYGEALNNFNVANARLISEVEDKMAHCSSVVIDKNKMYVGYYSDKENNVEAITQQTIKLMLCDTDIFGDKKNVVEMCKVGDVFQGLKQVTYAPYDPTMWCKDGNVRMYFSACDEAEGVMLGFLNYPKDGVFTRTKIEYNGVTYQMNFIGMNNLYTALGFAEFNTFRLIHLSDFIEYNGEIYTTLCMDNRNKALILKTTDGITFQLVDVLRDADNHREINGVIRNGKFYYVYRGFNGVFFSYYNLETGEKGAETYMVNASSKPMAFSTFFNDYFLLNTNGQRRSTSLYKLKGDKLEMLHGFYNTHSFHYGSCCYKEDYAYISFTTDDSRSSDAADRGNIKLLKFYIL